MQLLLNFLVITKLVAYSVHQWNKPPACFNGTQYPFPRVYFIEYTTQCCFTTWEASKTAPHFASIGSISPGKGYRHLLQLAYIVLSQGLTPLKDTFSCGPIIMKFAPLEICSITIPKPTDWTDFTAKVICPIMHNNLVKMTSWDCHQIPSTQFPHRLIQKTVILPYWGGDCCGSGICNPIEIL